MTYQFNGTLTTLVSYMYLYVPATLQTKSYKCGLESVETERRQLLQSQ